MRWVTIIFSAILVISACQDDEVQIISAPTGLMELPKGFEPIEFPEDNEFSEARWILGKKLFFDPIMSSDSSISCASCHKPELAFSDDVSISPGVDERLGERNAPSIANIAYHPYFTREGGVPTLEMQVLVPIQEHAEFDFNIVLLSDRLSQEPDYVQMSVEAYDRQPDPFVITRALACFERSLISGFSPYDQYVHYDYSESLSDSEVRGMQLFNSDKTNCSTCHEGFNFSNYGFANNGLYEDYPDLGRMRLTGQESDRAMFKIPSLRNVGLTAPYMHDGSMKTLQDVIEHYDQGGKENAQKSELIKPLNLTEQEKRDLISFLESLTDQSFIDNPLFKN